MCIVNLERIVNIVIDCKEEGIYWSNLECFED